MKYEVIAFGSADETVKAYESGRCDVFTADVSQLFAERLKLSNPAEHSVLPEVIRCACKLARALATIS